MKKNFFNHYKAALLFGVGCLLFIGFIVWQWQCFKQDELIFTKQLNQSTPSKNLFEAMPEVQTGLALKEEYQEIVNSPLFIEGRKPIASTSSAQGDSGNTLVLKLTGVILSPSHLLALIADDKNLSYRLKEGDEIQGWKIIEVRKDTVKLQKNNQLKELALVENKLSANNLPDNMMQNYPDIMSGNSPMEMEISNNPSEMPYAQ